MFQRSFRRTWNQLAPFRYLRNRCRQRRSLFSIGTQTVVIPVYKEQRHRLFGREPRSADELVTVYAGVLAAASNLDATTMAFLIPGERPSSIRRAMLLLEEEGALGARMMRSSNRFGPCRSSAPGATGTRHRPIWSASTPPGTSRRGSIQSAAVLPSRLMPTCSIAFDFGRRQSTN